MVLFRNVLLGFINFEKLYRYFYSKELRKGIYSKICYDMSFIEWTSH